MEYQETTVLVFKRGKHVDTYVASGCPNYRFGQKLILEDYNTEEPYYKKIEGRIIKIKHKLQVHKGFDNTNKRYRNFKTLIYVYLI